jgi:hypothetical protein
MSLKPPKYANNVHDLIYWSHENLIVRVPAFDKIHEFIISRCEPKNSGKNWRRIDRLGISRSFVVLVLVVSFFCAFPLFYVIDWSKPGDGDKFASMIYLVTLIVLLFYTYYTFQIAKFTAKGQALLFVQIQHSNVLKEFLKRWESSLGSGSHIYTNPIKKKENLDNFEYEKLDSSWEFRDFVDYHLPTGYSTLVSDWSDFKKKNLELNELSLDLYSRLRLDLRNEVNDISTKFNTKADTLNFDNFVMKIYELCFDYFNEPMENLESKLILTNNEIYYLEVASMVAFFKDDKGKMESVKSKMDNFISKKNLIENYNDYIIRIETKLDERDVLQKILRQNLTELIQRPLFAGTKCDMLKDFDIMECMRLRLRPSLPESFSIDMRIKCLT